jgi:hypothetical protein
MSEKLLVIISVGSVIIDLRLIRFSTLADIREKMGVYWNRASTIYRLQESL